MSKLKNAVIFIAILFIIFIFYICMYKNIDKLIPKYENELYTFTNNTKDEQTDFLALFDMFEEMESSINYKRISSEAEIKSITENEVIYNFIKNYIYGEGITQEVFNELVRTLYIGELTNTIYGDLKCISNKYIIVNSVRRFLTTGYVIAYSEDMKKIYFLNRDAQIMNVNSNVSVVSVPEYDSDEVNNYKEKYGLDVQEEDMQSANSRQELVKNVKEVFSKAMLNIEFNPDTIMYKECYILKDTSQNIMVLYNKENNVIWGILIGFQI